MTQRQKALGGFTLSLLAIVGFLFLWSYLRAHVREEYVVLDTTREQFLGQEPGALQSTSMLTLTGVSRFEDGDVHLLPLGVVGDWETLPSPLLPYPLEQSAAVAYIEPDPPHRRRIYLIGGYKYDPPNSGRVDTVFTSFVDENGDLSDWVIQGNHLPIGLSSFGVALNTTDVNGDPVPPTIYVVGGRPAVGVASEEVYYAQIDPVTLDVGEWHTATYGLPVGRYGLSAVANKGRLYAIGGFNGVNVYSGAVYHFPLIPSTGDTAGREVDMSLPGGAPNPNAIFHQTLLVPGASPSFPTDTLYVIGGYDGSSCTPGVLRGDIYPQGHAQEGAVQSWEDVAEDDLPAALASFGSALGNPQGAGRQIYLIGGAQGADADQPQRTIRSAVVDDEDNSFFTWYGSSWFTSPALPAARYRHATAQVGEFIYAIAGHGLAATEYYDNVLRGNLIGLGAMQFAPYGEFRSRVIDMGQKFRLTWLQWQSTMTPTHPGVTMTLQFRAGNRPDLSDAAGAWSEVLLTRRGDHAVTLVPVPALSNYPYYPPIARYVQYRAVLSTTPAFSNVSPILHEVGARVEESPDLYVSNVQISCDDPRCYGHIGLISKTIVVSVTVRNQGGSVPSGNNFFLALFITTTSDYEPLPPDWPTDPLFVKGSTYWGLQGANFLAGGKKTFTTTLFYTEAKFLSLYAAVDYNDTSPPPDYDVGEVDWDNNVTVLSIAVLDPNAASATETAYAEGTQTSYWATESAKPTGSGDTPTASPATPSPPDGTVYLPLITRGWDQVIYLPMMVGTPPAGPSTPTPVPSLQFRRGTPTPDREWRIPEQRTPTPSATP